MGDVIAVAELDCPRCDFPGPVRVAVDPGGTFVWVQCQRVLCSEQWKVSG